MVNQKSRCFTCTYCAPILTKGTCEYEFCEFHDKLLLCKEVLVSCDDYKLELDMEGIE